VASSTFAALFYIIGICQNKNVSKTKQNTHCHNTNDKENNGSCGKHRIILKWGVQLIHEPKNYTAFPTAAFDGPWDRFDEPDQSPWFVSLCAAERLVLLIKAENPANPFDDELDLDELATLAKAACFTCAGELRQSLLAAGLASSETVLLSSADRDGEHADGGVLAFLFPEERWDMGTEMVGDDTDTQWIFPCYIPDTTVNQKLIWQYTSHYKQSLHP